VALVTEPFETSFLLFSPALVGRERPCFFQVDRRVREPAFGQGQVREEDKDLGMAGILGDRPLKRRPDQRALIAQKCQLGEEGLGGGSSGWTLRACKTVLSIIYVQPG